MALAIASGTSAATITEGGLSNGTAIRLGPRAFVGSGPYGSSKIVVGKGCAVVLKSASTAADAYGRFGSWRGAWIDSQDPVLLPMPLPAAGAPLLEAVGAVAVLRRRIC